MTKFNNLPTDKKVVEPKSEGFSLPKINVFKLVVSFTVLVIVTGALTFALLTANSSISRVRANWEEIKFAYDKPALVKVVRQDYETKQQSLDDSFLTREKDPKDELIEAVVSKVQAPSK